MRPHSELEPQLSHIHTLAMDPHWISAIENQMRHLRSNRRFQQIVFMFFQKFIFSNDGDSSKAEADPIKEVATAVNHKQPWKFLKTSCCFSVSGNHFKRCDLVVSQCLETIAMEDVPDLKHFCHEMLERFLHGCSGRWYDTSSFILSTLWLLKILVISRPDVVITVRKQIGRLEKILEFFFTVYWIAEKSNIDEIFQDFREYIQPWVHSAAAVPFVFWVDEIDEKLSDVLSAFVKRLNPSTPELLEIYIRSIKYLKAKAYKFLMQIALLRFIGILLEDAVVSSDDRFEMLNGGLLLLIGFLMDPPQAYAEDEKLILSQINLLVSKATPFICSLCVGEVREDITEGRNILLHDLVEEINKAKAELRQLHVEIPCLSWNGIPQTNRLVYFDFHLGNLKKKLEAEEDWFSFEKDLIATVQEDLFSLRTFLVDFFDLQDEHEELKDICIRAGNLAYLVDHVTDSCLSFDVPIWSNLLHLSVAAEQIQLVKTEATEIKKNMYSTRVINAKVNSKLILPGQPKQANTAAKDDVKVGFADEEERIIDQLTGGVDELDVVAIVGMPGQGKTTLAQRVFDDSRVQNYFHKRAWCCISQTYDIKEILLDILKEVGKSVPIEEVPSVCYEDLAHRLRKCLKGSSYLVVLDDIWDIKAWNELKLSFPNDNNGSRILLTSRNHNIALEAKPDCCIVELHPLSSEESWKLLQMKLFKKGCCPQFLSDIGKTIAKNCKGLPLAIVLVAGLLKKDKHVSSWKQIARSLKSYVTSEACMNILEFSYRNLPDFLKPCFLYLGAFKEDEIIDAKKLIQLWIAEGFVQNDGTQSLEVVGSEYLTDLVTRSLVSVAKRSSRYGIKKCRVHDLLREFCLVKAEEERFFLVQDGSDHSLRYGPYRLCVDKWAYLVDSKPVVWATRSLLNGYRQLHVGSPSFFARFKFLRVLALVSFIINSAAFHAITELTHLRFLSIDCESDLIIPRSILNLWRLEVLALHHFSQSIPGFVMKMANLRHIIVDEEFYKLGTIIVEDDDELHQSPPLAELETFTFLGFSEALAFERVAQKLPNIRKLGLRLDFCVHLPSYFNKLESLNLKITKTISPSTFDFPSTLKKLNLRATEPLSGIMVSSIGKLSNLEVLKLQARFEDKRWDVEDDEFLNLKYLKLSHSDIAEWNASDESFPTLEQLVIKSCFELRDLPYRFAEIPTLKRINCLCSRTVLIPFQQIVAGQKDSGNEGLQFHFRL